MSGGHSWETSMQAEACKLWLLLAAPRTEQLNHQACGPPCRATCPCSSLKPLLLGPRSRCRCLSLLPHVLALAVVPVGLPYTPRTRHGRQHPPGQQRGRHVGRSAKPAARRLWDCGAAACRAPVTAVAVNGPPGSAGPGQAAVVQGQGPRRQGKQHVPVCPVCVKGRGAKRSVLWVGGGLGGAGARRAVTTFRLGRRCFVITLASCQLSIEAVMDPCSNLPCIACRLGLAAAKQPCRQAKAAPAGGCASAGASTCNPWQHSPTR